MERILVIGAGGMAKAIIDTIERAGEREIVGVIANDYPVGEDFFGYPLLGDDSRLSAVVEEHSIDGAVIAIGDNWQRSRVAHRLRESLPGLRFRAIVHPSAQIARGAVIGAGTMIMANVVLDSDARIGEFCIVNIAAVIGHDVYVGDFATVGGRAAIGGGARIGDYGALGIGVTVIHRGCVGEHTVVGMGSTVVADLPSRVVAYGTPARVVRQRNAADPYL